jgi:hypothetical protein
MVILARRHKDVTGRSAASLTSDGGPTGLFHRRTSPQRLNVARSHAHARREHFVAGVFEVTADAGYGRVIRSREGLVEVLGGLGDGSRAPAPSGNSHAPRREPLGAPRRPRDRAGRHQNRLTLVFPYPD